VRAAHGRSQGAAGTPAAFDLVMPSPAEITRSASQIAEDGMLLAMAWHAAVVLGIAVLGAGWRPTRRTAGLLLAAPCASVALASWLTASPFNGAVFAVLTALLVLAALRLPPGRIQPGPGWALLGGAIVVLFGLAYPQFLGGRAPAIYLVAAPVGLLPCPTLAVVIGFTLVAGGLQSRLWTPILLAAGTFYGLFGAAVLGVLLDLGLLAGTAALALVAARERPVYR
jgi:hypothetical protein